MPLIRFLGHSAVEVKTNKYTLLFDPFITGNPVSPVTADDLHPNYIFLTHFHGDHTGDAESLARRTGATIITTYEAGEELREKGLNVHTMGVGGTYRFPFGLVRVTMAVHGSGHPGALAAGFVVHTDGRRIYHAGDTALFSDLKLLNGIVEEPGIDVALLPVGDNYTMGPRDAAIAAEWVGAKVAIPVHWGTFPILHGEPAEFVELVGQSGQVRPVLLQPGETFQC